MRKFIILGAVLAAGIFLASSSHAGGRLNFMLINLTGTDIVDAKICPTGLPQYESENLLKTPLDSNSRIYIGPNYYGEQNFWNISLKWGNGYEQTFPKLLLTRYNTYTVYSTPRGVKIRQSYQPATAGYEFGPDAPSYMAGEADKTVRVSAPEKIAGVRASAVEPGKATEKAAAKNLSFADAAAEKALALKTTLETTRDGKTSTVLPVAGAQSGDKVRMLFSTNRDGHIYWVAKNADGQYQVLYPTPQTGMDNKVVRNQEYAVPVMEAAQFDGKNGSQTVMAVLSPQAIPDLDQAVKLAADGKLAEASRLVDGVIAGHENKRTADLIFEEEYDEDVDTQSQLADGETPFVGVYEITGQ